MNGLREIQESIRNFICEKVQIQEQIAKIEAQRTQLAQQRNAKKQIDANCVEVNELGRQISELGNKSQELQNCLDSKVNEIKSQVNFAIDNLVAEGIRKIRIANGEIQDLNTRIERQKERNAKYQLQKQEFYLRFGRIPELSERSVMESKLQEKESEKSQLEIEQLKQQIGQVEGDITVLARAKRDIKNGNWNTIIESENINEEVHIEELNIEEIQPIEEIYVEEFGQVKELNVEELYIEEFEPIEEIYVEAFEPMVEEIHVEEFEPIAQEFKEKVQEAETSQSTTEKTLDEIEELARAIIDEIVAEQTCDNNINKIEEQPLEKVLEEKIEDIITFEKEENEKNEKVIIPLFGQRATISNITIKFEDANLVYKAQMSDGEEIKIYPSQLGEESVLLRDKQNREECKEILINYAISQYRVLDKKVVNKIDPLVCELLIECAEKYGYNAQEVVYNYAASFADGDLESVPGIIYNLSYIDQSNLSKKEKAIIKKICKNARKNDNIDVIEPFSGFKKIKYVLKRLFAVNNVKVLPEAKY